MKLGKQITAVFSAAILAVTMAVPAAAPATAATNYVNYAEALQKSLYMYDANMCGTGVGENSGLAWRDDCHTSDTQVTYNGKTVDVSGGYHDAGDHAKFGLPQAYAMVTLGLSYYYFGEAFDKTGTKDHLKRITDYGADYFKRCTVYNGSNVEAFAYTVGDGNLDHAYWGSPEDQEKTQPGPRKAYWATASNPGTDCVSLTAAALAVNYLNFKDPTDLQIAKDLFAFADKNNKETCTDGNGQFYTSGGWIDDYALAATLLNIATGEASYKAKAETVIDPKQNGGKNDYHYPEFPYNWDGVYHAVHWTRNEMKYSYQMSWGNENFDFSSTLDKLENKQKTPKGFTFIMEWGSARYNAGLQMSGLIYDKITGGTKHTEWAKGQMDYIFGNNEFGKCLMVGYNDISSKFPHHRASSSPAYGNSVENEIKNNIQTQSHVLIGALCGGPKDANGTYRDTATDYIANEVTIDYNAPLVGALAGLYCAYGQNDTPIDESTLPEVRIICGTKPIETTTTPTETTPTTPTTSPIVFADGPLDVTFDANGGTGAPDKIYNFFVPYSPDPYSYKIPEQIPTHSEPMYYEFIGWAKDKTATQPDFTPGQIITVKDFAVGTLYAVWVGPIMVDYGLDIYFNANGGSGNMPQPYFNFGPRYFTYTVPNQTPTREGYTFLGWAFDRNATEPDLKVGDSRQFDCTEYYSSLTLYAVWVLNEVITTPTVTTPPNVKLGDLNGDDDINTADLIILAKNLSGRIGLTETQKAAARLIGGSDAVNSDCLLTLIKYLTGEIKSLPV